MQERHHVKTTPGEPFAVPEYTPHSVRREEGGNMQMDDINIPIVAVSVAFFGVLLAVTIVSLQAGFYNYQASERASKMLAQDDPRTVLGAMLEQDRSELKTAGYARDMNPATTGPAATSQANATPRKVRIPVEQAMTIVEKEYAAAQSGGATGNQ